MFQDLDQTLAALLEKELPQDALGQAASPLRVTFAAPDHDFPGSLKALKPPLVNLFLYDLRENRELRSNEWTAERDGGGGGGVSRQRPPVRVDCSYLVTAWGSSTDAEPRAKEEHWILGEVARALVKYSTLPEALLQGGLQGQQPPLPAAALGAGQLQSPSEFWQAMGGKPRPALHYTVTVALAPWAAVAAGKPVIDRRIRFRQTAGDRP